MSELLVFASLSLSSSSSSPLSCLLLVDQEIENRLTGFTHTLTHARGHRRFSVGCPLCRFVFVWSCFLFRSLCVIVPLSPLFWLVSHSRGSLLGSGLTILLRLSRFLSENRLLLRQILVSSSSVLLLHCRGCFFSGCTAHD